MHCSEGQQRRLAADFVEVLGDALYARRLPVERGAWPSPRALARRVLLKGAARDDIEITQQFEITQQ